MLLTGMWEGWWNWDSGICVYMLKWMKLGG